MAFAAVNAGVMWEGQRCVSRTARFTSGDCYDKRNVIIDNVSCSADNSRLTCQQHVIICGQRALLPVAKDRSADKQDAG